MPSGLKPLVVIAAGIACLVLAFVVLVGHPHNELDLVAWGVVAAGVGLVTVVLPSSSTTP
jgi:hypothetical protein